MNGYVRQALQPRAQGNAASFYIFNHLTALGYAARIREAREANIPYNKDLAWQAILHEVYALHFLEDSFSSGHIMGGVSPSAQVTCRRLSRTAAEAWR